MAKKAMPDRQQIKLLVPGELHAELLEAATERGLPISTFVRELVSQALRKPAESSPLQATPSIKVAKPSLLEDSVEEIPTLSQVLAQAMDVAKPQVTSNKDIASGKVVINIYTN